MTNIRTACGILLLGVLMFAPSAYQSSAAAARLKCSACHDNCCTWALAKVLIERGEGHESGASALVDYHWRRYRDPMPCANKRTGTWGYNRCVVLAYKRCGRRHCKCFGFNSVMDYIPWLQAPPTAAGALALPLPRVRPPGTGIPVSTQRREDNQ